VITLAVEASLAIKSRAVVLKIRVKRTTLWAFYLCITGCTTLLAVEAGTLRTCAAIGISHETLTLARTVTFVVPTVLAVERFALTASF
jgi:hypothetical protein